VNPTKAAKKRAFPPANLPFFHEFQAGFLASFPAAATKKEVKN